VGDRAVVLFSDGESLSHNGVYLHYIGSLVGLTIKEIWDQLASAPVDECSHILRERYLQMNEEWGIPRGGRGDPTIVSLDEEDVTQPRRTNYGDSGVFIVNIREGTVKNLRGSRWARTYTVERLAELQDRD
jgi:hypothetical protein